MASARRESCSNEGREIIYALLTSGSVGPGQGPATLDEIKKEVKMPGICPVGEPGFASRPMFDAAYKVVMAK